MIVVVVVVVVVVVASDPSLTPTHFLSLPQPLAPSSRTSIPPLLSSSSNRVGLATMLSGALTSLSPGGVVRPCLVLSAFLWWSSPSCTGGEEEEENGIAVAANQKEEDEKG